MDGIMSAAAIWFIIGLALLLLEFALPGLIIMFFGIGAWIVGLTLLFADVSLNTQLVIFMASSTVSVLLLRNWLKKRLMGAKKSNEVVDDDFIGKTAKATTPIMPGQNGKVFFKGSAWSAKSDDVIEQGENVLITGNESIILIVKSIKSI